MQNTKRKFAMGMLGLGAVVIAIAIALALPSLAQASQPNPEPVAIVPVNQALLAAASPTVKPSATRAGAATRTPTKTATKLPITSTPSRTPTKTPTKTPTGQPGNYVVIGWNDLGMHCYNRDFRDIAVLPPYNNLYVQVILRGNPPKIVTTGLTVSYNFPENTYSVGKSNFWDFDVQLFGVNLPANIGLKGKGLADKFDAAGDHFVAEGIPLTEFNDNNWTVPQPYQLADIVVKDAAGKTLATNQVVAPVSTEMRCDKCHSDGQMGITTGRVETNILTLHDKENAEEYPAGHTTPLMNRRPVLCAECHASNALGAPGVSGLPNLSNAMHSKHAGKSPDTLQGCYNCHPGPDTKCLRDVMSVKDGMDCISCHGGMEQVSKNPNPWLNEPRCDTCHTAAAYRQDKPLFRESKGHGGLYCQACHDSTHAIAPSSQPRDAIKFMNLQGAPGPLHKCTVCHLNQPTAPGPHGLTN